MWGGVKRYVTNVCMYTALFCLFCDKITQTAHCRPRRRRHRESGPRGNIRVSEETNFRKFCCLRQGTSKSGEGQPFLSCQGWKTA